MNTFRYYSLALLALLVLLAPPLAQAQNVLDGYDGPAPTATPAPQVDRSGELVILTHSKSDLIESSSVACVQSDPPPPPQVTSDNSFWRIFDLPEFGVEGDFEILFAEVGFGVVSYSGAEIQTAHLRFHEVDGDFAMINLLLEGEVEIEMEEALNQTLHTLSIDDVIMPAGSLMAVEIAFDSCIDAGGCHFRVGTNTAGETGHTYLSSEGCGIFEPTPAGEIGGGFPDTQWVLTIIGTDLGVSDEPGATAGDVELGIYPNPTLNVANVSVTMHSPEAVTVSLVDLLGRTIEVLHEGTLSGEAHFRLDTARLTSGSYVLKVEGEHTHLSRRVIVVR